MKWLRIIIVVCWSCSLMPAFAVAEEGSLTWDACVKESLAQHPDLVSAMQKVKETRADKNITQGALFPQIASVLDASTRENTAGETSDSYSYGLTGEQLVFDGLKTPIDVMAASRTITAQEYNYAVESSNVRLNLRAAFTTLLRAQDLIALTEDIARRRRQNLELVQLRHDAGREHRGALLTSEADLAQAEFEVTQAKRNLSLAQRSLTKELGRQEKTSLAVEGTFDILDATPEKPDFEFLADNTPFLKELIARKEAARLGYHASQADLFPKVYLNGSVGKDSEHWPPRDDEWTAGVSMSFPLFEGGTKIARVSKAKSQLKQAEADARSGHDSVILTLEETWKNFEDAIDNVVVKQKFLEASEERAKIANAQYSQGLVSFDDWIIIENSLVLTKKAYLDAQADLLIAEANWIQAKGGTLEYVQE